MEKSLIITCPHCQKSFNYFSSDFRPFCSERCRLIDLGAWLDEGYRIPVKDSEIEDEEKENQKEDEDNDEKNSI